MRAVWVSKPSATCQPATLWKQQQHQARSRQPGESDPEGSGPEDPPSHPMSLEDPQSMPHQLRATLATARPRYRRIQWVVGVSNTHPTSNQILTVILVATASGSSPQARGR